MNGRQERERQKAQLLRQIVTGHIVHDEISRVVRDEKLMKGGQGWMAEVGEKLRFVRKSALQRRCSSLRHFKNDVGAGSDIRLNPAGMSSFISSGTARGLKRKATTQKASLVGG